MAAQSETTNPWNPSSCLSTSVRRWWLPCIFVPFQRLYEAMTDPTPALMAAT